MDTDDIDPEDLEELEEEVDLEEVDPEDLDVEAVEEEDDFDEDFVEGAEEAVEETAKPKGGATGRKAKDKDEDEDDEDLLTADDVEEDLDKILKDKLTAEEVPGEDEEEPETDDRGSAEEGLQPKRADEQLCNRCFLLVRKAAPVCPVGDDDCPIFAG